MHDHASTRTPDELAEGSGPAIGVHSLDRFVVAVPDLQQAQAFYQAFGLDVRPSMQGLDLRTFGCDQVWGTLVAGPRKRLEHLSFGAYASDLGEIERRLPQFGVERAPAPAGFDGGGLWFRDHDGVLVQVREAPKSSPVEPTVPSVLRGPSGQGAAPVNSQAPTIRPTRFAHILLFTSSVERAIRFYTQVLGLRLSDRSGDEIAFMHGIHGSDHHLIAVVKSTGPGVHHTSWDVRSIDEVGLGRMQMAAAGHAAGWGIGRHVLGSNYFHYVRDPWGSYAEYSFDIDFIARGQRWTAGDFPPEDAFYLWGPDTPPDFPLNHELD